MFLPIVTALWTIPNPNAPKPITDTGLGGWASQIRRARGRQRGPSWGLPQVLEGVAACVDEMSLCLCSLFLLGARLPYNRYN